METDKVVIDKETGAFIDQNCVFDFQGKKFESGGAWICKRVDNGKFGGRVYATCEKDERRGTVQNWHGTLKMPAYFGKIYRSNFGDRRRSVWFTYKNMSFQGMWCNIDYNELVTVKQIK